MALDTANKRASAMGDMLPLPDGTIDELDRAQTLDLYALAADEGEPFDPIPAGRGRKRSWVMGLPHFQI